ncbi:MAG TPA: hypothetical protein VD789_00290, partial [Thermomicrobiales bacterium]|nr:hypothetical protein [Thermomicrobiales bacterium]
QGLGRSMKVGREEIAGLITALREFVARDDESDRQRWEGMLARIAEPLEGIEGVQVHLVSDVDHPVPQLWIELDVEILGFSAYEAVNRLLEGEPRVAVSESRAELGVIGVNPIVLNEDEVEVIRARLPEVLGARP